MSIALLEEVVAGRAPSVLPITVDQYHQMIGLGILREGAPVELIDGVLVYKNRSDRGGSAMAHGPRHALGLKRLERFLRGVEAWGFHLHLQLPVTLDTLQELEPDLAVVRGRPEDYLSHHPRPEDVLAIMEVADTTLDYDRTTKQRLYAAARLAVYWIVNLVDNRVEVYEGPLQGEGIYPMRTDCAPPQTVRLTISATQSIEGLVSDILPPEA